MGKEGNEKGDDIMAVSKGVILNVKGKTAQKILEDLKRPNPNKELLDKCAKMAAQLKEK